MSNVTTDINTDIERRRGDTYADKFQVISEATGLPIDITGATFLLTVDPSKAPINATNNLYVLTGTITDAPNGIVEFAPSAVQADQIGKYYYDAEMTAAGGRIRTFQVGKYTYVQDLTK